jgi:acyl carrier protein
MEDDIRNSLLELISVKLKRIGVAQREITGRFDLVKSGLLSSLEFVDMITTLERRFQCEVDYETAFEKGNFTTIDGVISNFKNILHG